MLEPYYTIQQASRIFRTDEKTIQELVTDEELYIMYGIQAVTINNEPRVSGNNLFKLSKILKLRMRKKDLVNLPIKMINFSEVFKVKPLPN